MAEKLVTNICKAKQAPAFKNHDMNQHLNIADIVHDYGTVQNSVIPIIQFLIVTLDAM